IEAPSCINQGPMANTIGTNQRPTASPTGPNQHPAASAISIPRTHLIMGLCLPLAVLLGYFLAQPLEAGSMAVVLLVISVLSVPLLMKWHHPLLILCWNVTAN